MTYQINPSYDRDDWRGQEVDGKQHYADGEKASPRLYSEMAAEDRRLRLRGYEVYRIGGFELSQPQAAATLWAFFGDLFEKHITT